MSIALSNRAIDPAQDSAPEQPKPARTATPAVKFSPETWAYLYWGILLASVTVGCLTLLNGGSISAAIVRFFLTLLGATFLGIVFLSAVVMPLHVKRYELLQKQAQEEAEQRQAAARQAQAPPEEAALDEQPDELSAPGEFFAQLDGEAASDVVLAATRQIENAIENPMENPIEQTDFDSSPEALAESSPPRELPIDDQASGLRRMAGASH